MKRRDRSRSDPLNYYESPKLRRALVVNLISATEKSVWSASISSRIPTVILVVIDHQINYNWYNEPSAVSPFKSFKLRHAWLSLWDKHMTTGRINQVTCRLALALRQRPTQQASPYDETSLLVNERLIIQFPFRTSRSDISSYSHTD